MSNGYPYGWYGGGQGAPESFMRGGGSAWDQLLGSYLTDYSNLVAAEEEWYGRQGETTDWMQQGAGDYLDSVDSSVGQYRDMMGSLGSQYRSSIGDIASGMESSVRGYGNALRGNVSGILGDFGGRMEDLYEDNINAINNYLDITPQFRRLQNRFGSTARKAEAMADRAINRGGYWADKLASEGAASGQRLSQLGADALSEMLGYAADVEQGQEKLDARVEKADQFSERIMQQSDEMWGRFEDYQSSVLAKTEQYLNAQNTWAAKAIHLQQQAAEDANLNLAANVVAQNEAQQAQFAAMRDTIMASDLPPQVIEAQLVELDQQAAAAYMRNGAETQAAAVQAKFTIDSSVANMMMAAAEQETATAGMWAQTQQSLVQMASFIESQGMPAMAGMALNAQELGTQAAIASQGVVETAANIKMAGQQLRMSYAQAAEASRMGGLEAAAQTDLAFTQQANQAMANSINALSGELQAVFGEASVLQNAAEMTLHSNGMMANWFHHASNLATQTEFQIHNANVNAAMRSAEIRANMEGNIYQGSMAGEGNIFSGLMRSHEVSLNQINAIAQHHASYRANPVSVADIFLGMMGAEAASYAAGWGSLANNPALGFNMGGQWNSFFG